MKNPRIERRSAGFTLYELLITVTVIGIILAFGAPNLVDFRSNSRMTAAANDLHSSFYLARSEAARAKTNVSICASANSQEPDPDCGGGFEDGWIVFVDPNGNVEHDAGEVILRRHDELNERISISSPGMAPYFSFSASGLGRGTVRADGPPITLAVMCDGRGNETAAGGRSAARALVVTPLGRATVLHSKARIQQSIDTSGATCQ